MIWLFTILVVLVLGAVAVVAAGRGGSMAETYDDRPDVRVRADGPLTAADLRKVRFTTALRGYRMSEVDTLLDRLATELEQTNRPADPPGRPARHRAADDPPEPPSAPERP
jgi:DivIVA domain-containing protein